MEGDKAGGSPMARGRGLGSTIQSSPQYFPSLCLGDNGWAHGPYFIESAKCTWTRKGGKEQSRGLILMTLGDEGEPTKKTITPLFSFKTNLNLFFPEWNRKGQELIYPFSFTLEANTEMESALWGEWCKVTAFTQLCPRSSGSRLTCEGLLFFPPMLIECADREFRSDYTKMKYVPRVPASIHAPAHCPPPRQNENFFWPTKPIFRYYFSLSLFISPNGNIPVAAG